MFRILLLCTFCSTFLNAQTDNLPELHYRWQTDTVFRTVESIAYDSVTQMAYTANINGHFMARDGNGSIGKLSLGGKIIEPEWITGLDAPTGLCLHASKLYTTDIDRLVEIDVKTGQIISTLFVPGAKALNDVAVSPEGVLFLSDTGGNQIFKVIEDRVEVFLTDIETPNGLVYADKLLFVSLWTPGQLLVVTEDGRQFPYTTGIAESDGIELLPDGNFLVSSWGGALNHVFRPRAWSGTATRGGAVTQLLNLRKEGVQVPDVCYVPGKEMLLVPTFNDHRIRVYDLSWRDQSTDPFLLETQAPAGYGLKRVKNATDPDRRLHQKQLYAGKDLAVYVVSSETKTAQWEGYAIDEFIEVLDGRARLRPEKADEDDFYYAGQYFLVPEGYRGDWETQSASGDYLELSVIAQGEASSDSGDLRAQAWSFQELAGNPPEGGAPEKELQGRKLHAWIEVDTLPSHQLTTSKDELVILKTGSVELRSAKGRAWKFYAGDRFILPAGFRGRWSRLGERPVRSVRVGRR